MVIVKKIGGNFKRMKKEYPNSVILNVTDKGLMCELSPKFPHNGIPIPVVDGIEGVSVDGIWNGFKVFERRGIDKKYFEKDMMKEVDREIKYGCKCRGFRNGLKGKLMNEVDARKKILIPAYNWMLENRCGKLVDVLRKISRERTLILLDYSENGDVENISEPFSCATLLKEKIEN
jgi:hypothetical protein